MSKHEQPGDLAHHETHLPNADPAHAPGKQHLDRESEVPHMRDADHRFRNQERHGGQPRVRRQRRRGH